MTNLTPNLAHAALTAAGFEHHDPDGSGSPLRGHYHRPDDAEGHFDAATVSAFPGGTAVTLWCSQHQSAKACVEAEYLADLLASV